MMQPTLQNALGTPNYFSWERLCVPGSPLSGRVHDWLIVLMIARWIEQKCIKLDWGRKCPWTNRQGQTNWPCVTTLVSHLSPKLKEKVLSVGFYLVTMRRAVSKGSWVPPPRVCWEAIAWSWCWWFPFLAMFQICSWNIRYLNNQGKRSLVKFVVSKFKSFVHCFQKSKVEEISRSSLSSFASSFFDKCQFIKSEGASWGLITRWSSKVFSCSEVLVHKFSFTLKLKHYPSGSNFYVTNVYAPPSWNEKEEFSNELATLKEACGGLWVMCGDFNLIRNQQEISGRC